MLVEDQKSEFFLQNISKKEIRSTLVFYDDYASIIFEIITDIVMPGDEHEAFVEAFHFIINNIQGYKQEHGSFKLWITNNSRNVAVRKLIASNKEPFEEPLTLKKTVYSLYKLRNFSVTQISKTLHIPGDLVASLLRENKPSIAGNQS